MAMRCGGKRAGSGNPGGSGRPYRFVRRAQDESAAEREASAWSEQLPCPVQSPRAAPTPSRSPHGLQPRTEPGRRRRTDRIEACTSARPRWPGSARTQAAAPARAVARSNPPGNTDSRRNSSFDSDRAARGPRQRRPQRPCGPRRSTRKARSGRAGEGREHVLESEGALRRPPAQSQGKPVEGPTTANTGRGPVVGRNERSARRKGSRKATAGDAARAPPVSSPRHRQRLDDDVLVGRRAAATGGQTSTQTTRPAARGADPPRQRLAVVHQSSSGDPRGIAQAAAIRPRPS